MRKRKKIFGFWFTFWLAIFAGVGLLIYFNIPETPEAEMKQALESLSKSKKAQADIYATKLYLDARAKYESAMAYWRAENSKFYFSRNYEKTKAFAQQSNLLSIKAISTAYARAKQSGLDTRATIDMLENEIFVFEKSIMKLPIPAKLIKDFSRGKILLEEAKIAWKKAQYDLTEKRIESAKRLILNTIKIAEKDIEDYFRNIDKWERQVAQTLKSSRESNLTVIIVDKFAQECRVYTGGNLKRTFQIELGPNWLGGKLYQGDRTTPEGIYRVTDKKERRRTIYYKALLINYPNAEDKARFYSLRSQGKIPGNVSIGGNIEIHGEGGKGFHWTNGCIALENKDMDALYRMVGIDTPVTIVGSLLPFNEWKAKMLSNYTKS